MNTCKTCAHWKLDPTDWRAIRVCRPEDPDSDAPMKLPFVVRRCGHPAMTFCERPVEPHGFGVMDCSEAGAELLTAEDFGCIRWEANQQPA